MKTVSLNVKLFPAGSTKPRFVGSLVALEVDHAPADTVVREDLDLVWAVERAVNDTIAGRMHIEIAERNPADTQEERVFQRVFIANKLSVWIARQTSIPTHSEFIDIYAANQLLHDVITENDRLVRALRSLVTRRFHFRDSWIKTIGAAVRLQDEEAAKKMTIAYVRRLREAGFFVALRVLGPDLSWFK